MKIDLQRSVAELATRKKKGRKNREGKITDGK